MKNINVKDGETTTGAALVYARSDPSPWPSADQAGLVARGIHSG